MLDVREPLELTEEEQSARTKGGRGRASRKPPEHEQRPARSKGLKMRRVLSAPEKGPFDGIEWERRKASITDGKGNVVFVQEDIEVPKSWSMLATNVVASKYFYGAVGSPEREFSVQQLVHRVARTIADWGLNDGYFATPEDADIF